MSENRRPHGGDFLTHIIYGVGLQSRDRFLKRTLGTPYSSARIEAPKSPRRVGRGERCPIPYKERALGGANFSMFDLK